MTSDKPMGCFLSGRVSVLTNVMKRLRYFPYGTWCTLQDFSVLPIEQLATAEARRMDRFLHGLILPFWRHYEEDCGFWRTLGGTPWLSRILEGRMEMAVLLWKCLSVLACRFQKSLREGLLVPLSISNVPSQYPSNGRELSLRRLDFIFLIIIIYYFFLLDFFFLSKKGIVVYQAALTRGCSAKLSESRLSFER